MKLKSNKGFTGVDVAIATLIFIIFAALIGSLFYNISNTTKKMERKTTATNLAIEVIEGLKVMEFDALNNDLKVENVKDASGENINVPTGYNVAISVDDYKNGNVVKTISVVVSYKNKNDIEDVKIETLVKRET